MTMQLVETIGAEELREQQAKRRATRLAGLVQGTMGLESQAIGRKELKAIPKRNVNRLLAGPGRKLWDE